VKAEAGRNKAIEISKYIMHGTLARASERTLVSV
jgi:hypothetical protein